MIAAQAPAEKVQIKISKWRLLARVIARSEHWAERIAFALILVIAVLMTRAATWNEAGTRYRAYLSTEVVKNRIATMQNRCLGFTILSKIDKTTIVPVWCAPLMDDLRDEPPLMPVPVL